MKAEEKPLIVALTNVKIDIGKKATDHGEKYGNGTDANGRFSKTLCILIHDFVPPFRLFDKRTDDDAEHNDNTKTVFLDQGIFLLSLTQRTITTLMAPMKQDRDGPTAVTIPHLELLVHSALERPTSGAFL